ncbi:hypothetical protein E2C01_095288 [Portunus trituberculatus]|uniref:Uncharacterized protein n=1 Tax=Portunus trituberculatus TaxID=210409 RepID=A0A5B7JZT2_PORTR|nr:hypothetical protein [Portunus trituberculatus]
MKGVGKDIVMAASILTKSLTVLDNFAQNRHPQVAQEAAKHIEESEKLKTKFTNKKQLPSTSRFGGWRSRGSQGNSAFKGFTSRFHPYGQHMYGYKGEQRQSSFQLSSDAKNSRGRGRSMSRR